MEKLHDFGRRICGVSQPTRVIERVAQAMRQALEQAKGDARLPTELLAQMQDDWETGLAYAR